MRQGLSVSAVALALAVSQPIWAEESIELAQAQGGPVQAAAGSGVVFSLAELEQLILSSNPQLMMAQQSRLQAQAAINTASAFNNPRIEYSDGRQRPVFMGNTGNIQGWGVAQFIDNPWVRSARIDAAQQGLNISDALVGLNRGEVIAQIRLRAFEYLLRIEEVRVASEELSALEQIRDRVKVRVDSGEAPRYESIKAEAEFITARQRQQSAMLAKEQARIRLNQLAAGRLPAQWSLNVSLDGLPVTSSVLDPQALELRNNSELAALRADVMRLQARVDEASASRLPGVELRYNDLKDPDNRQSVMGASVQLPLLDQRRGPRDEARAELMRARTRLEGRDAELKLQLQAATMALQMAKLRVEALEGGAIRDAQAALNVAQAAYRFGERGILDVLDAQRVLRSVRADLLQARYQVQAAAVEISLLTGQYAKP